MAALDCLAVFLLTVHKYSYTNSEFPIPLIKPYHIALCGKADELITPCAF
jgi:hypothetical protein